MPATGPASTTPVPALKAIRFPAPGSVPPTVTLSAWSRTPGPWLPRAIVPVTSVPMKLPSIVEPFAYVIEIPEVAFPEMTFPAPAAEPPIVLFQPPEAMPELALPRGRVPVTSVPMKLPWTTLFVTVLSFRLLLREMPP